jgi:hypothetical protein
LLRLFIILLRLFIILLRLFIILLRLFIILLRLFSRPLNIFRLQLGVVLVLRSRCGGVVDFPDPRPMALSELRLIDEGLPARWRYAHQQIQRYTDAAGQKQGAFGKSNASGTIDIGAGDKLCVFPGWLAPSVAVPPYNCAREASEQVAGGARNSGGADTGTRRITLSAFAELDFYPEGGGGGGMSLWGGDMARATGQ